MTYTLEKATPNAVIGRLVGSGEPFIAIAVSGEYLLAVSLDGDKYVTWAYGPTNYGADVSVFWGTYFDVVAYADAYGAFRAATLDFERRTGRA